MKKVGILTLYYKTYNFGAQLQAYALQKYIEKQGYMCEIIRFKWSNEETIAGYENAKIDQAKFAEFSYGIKHTKRVYTAADIDECVDDFDIFVVGSDQIWGIENDMPLINLPIMCLNFLPKNKVGITYAASFGGMRASSRNDEIIKNEIKNFRYVSVRERSASRYIQEIRGIAPEVVLDPVFLLDEGEWRSVANESDESCEPYLLFYTAGADPRQEEILLNLSEQLNVKVRRLGYIDGELIGPKEFITWIKNAKYILTDSFHATVFSIIFHKNFVVLPVDNKQKDISKNSRLIDLLETFGMKERYISDIADAQNAVKNAEKLFAQAVDYDHVEKTLEVERQKSFKYIKVALESQSDTMSVCDNDSIGDEPDNRPQRFYMKSISKNASMDRMKYENAYWEEFVARQALLRAYYNEIERSDLMLKVAKVEAAGAFIDNYLIESKSIFIYGAGKLGKSLLKCFKKVDGFFDKAKSITNCEGIHVYQPYSDEVRLEIGDGSGITVVVTPVWDFYDIKEELVCEYRNIHSVSAKELVEQMLQKLV